LIFLRFTWCANKSRVQIAVYHCREVSIVLDELKLKGKISHYGVSVPT